MKLVPVSELFEGSYGTNLELNALEEQDDGVPFISRTRQNNGVSARVALVPGLGPRPGGVLTVALSGSPLATFLQEEPFYTGYHVAVLESREPMSRDVLLYYATCLQANRYRFSYGRQANRSLGALLVPSLTDVPAWVTMRTPTGLDQIVESGRAAPSQTALKTAAWQPFSYTDLFEIVRGKGPSLGAARSRPGPTPFVTASDKNNGISAWTSFAAQHVGGLTVATNGSVGECFYQPAPFLACSDITVLTPKTVIPTEAMMAMAALIRREGKLKFGYGRKWGLQRMQDSTMRLPVTANGSPDFNTLANLIRGLPAYQLLKTLTA